MWKKLLLLLVVLLILAALAWTFFQPAPAQVVSELKPETQTLRTTLDLNGLVINDQLVNITALLNGELKQVKAREGDAVKQNQILAILDSQQAQSLLDQATAELAYKRQKLGTVSKSYTRVKNLSQAGSTSKQSLDDSLDALRGAQAEVGVAEASVSLAQLQLNNATVKAPFDGVVTRRHIEVGQWVEAATPMFELVAEEGYLIQAQVDASDWARVSLGQPVNLTTESSPDKQWQSEVSWIAPTISRNDRDAKSVAIRFEFGNDAPTLLLGQEVDAELELARVEDVLTLPLSVMLEREPGAFSVFVYDNGVAKSKPVDVGMLNATHAEITGGLSANDAVIYSRSRPLRDEQAVELQ